jgi:hypothetical protein
MGVPYICRQCQFYLPLEEMDRAGGGVLLAAGIAKSRRTNTMSTASAAAWGSRRF